MHADLEKLAYNLAYMTDVAVLSPLVGYLFGGAVQMVQG